MSMLFMNSFKTVLLCFVIIFNEILTFRGVRVAPLLLLFRYLEKKGTNSQDTSFIWRTGNMCILYELIFGVVLQSPDKV